MLPVLAYTGATLVGGNAFVAAFVAGTAFAGTAAWVAQEELALGLAELLSEPLGYAVWLAFGFAALPLVRAEAGWREVVFAALSLTVVRMVPVALSLLGTRLRPATLAFVGWSGPRGLASVVFALLAIEGLDDTPQVRTAIGAVALTVLLSVVVHGVTAEPLAARYGAWVARSGLRSRRPTRRSRDRAVGRAARPGAPPRNLLPG